MLGYAVCIREQRGSVDASRVQSKLDFEQFTPRK
jgi:hypothetical protein